MNTVVARAVMLSPFSGGIGASGDASQPARDAGVGVYVDGVFLGRALGLGTALSDIERIEMLKGPQGTLFGRNTMGGEADFNAWDKRGIRASALWQPAESLRVSYAYDNAYDATTPFHAQVLVAGPLASPLQRAGATLARRSSSILGGAQQDSVGKTSGHTLVVDWTLNDSLQLKSISSYRDLEQGQFDQGFIDWITTFAANRPFARYSLAQVRQHQYSEELQLIGRTDQIQFVAGAFFYHGSAASRSRRTRLARCPTPPMRRPAAPPAAWSWSSRSRRSTT